jgi:putative heme iron utilization protein
MAANQERNFTREAAELLIRARSATLATLAAGKPYASLVTPALDAHGAPLLLLSNLAAHTRHLLANPACSLLVVGDATDENPQTAPRLTLSATAELSDTPAARARFLAFHPYAEQYIGFTDFHLWRLIMNDAAYVGGFAASAQLSLAALHHEISLALTAQHG